MVSIFLFHCFIGISKPFLGGGAGENGGGGGFLFCPKKKRNKGPLLSVFYIVERKRRKKLINLIAVFGILFRFFFSGFWFHSYIHSSASNFLVCFFSFGFIIFSTVIFFVVAITEQNSEWQNE